jgi:hypothetical protein
MHWLSFLSNSSNNIFSSGKITRELRVFPDPGPGLYLDLTLDLVCIYLRIWIALCEWRQHEITLYWLFSESNQQVTKILVIYFGHVPKNCQIPVKRNSGLDPDPEFWFLSVRVQNKMWSRGFLKITVVLHIICTPVSECSLDIDLLFWFMIYFVFILLIFISLQT